MLIKPNTQNLGAKIIICGVGGAGNNAVNSMIESGEIQGVEFIAINTDEQALERSQAETVLAIGKDLTKGLGAGGNPAVGKQAASDSVDDLSEALAGADMVFVSAGMGGGTGTGASPIIAGIAKQLGALTVGVVTKPFLFEGTTKQNYAVQGIDELRSKVDALIVIPNQRVLEIIDRNVTFKQAMQKSDEVLLNAIKSISDIITLTGQINVDFADVKAIMQDAGTALMGMGDSGNKESRAVDAAKMAINSPLLDYSINGAKGVLVSIRGSANLSMTEISEAVEVVRQYVDESANIKFGVILDEDMGDSVVVTVLATGFDSDPMESEFRHVPHEETRVESSPQLRHSDYSGGNSSTPTNNPSPQQQSSPSQGTMQQNTQQKKRKDDDDGDADLDIPAFMRRRNNL
ncbi:MAG: cell division protein FtsZ [Candidatus Dojkabacteria bacterium]